MNLQAIDFPVRWETPPPEILHTIEQAERLRGQLIPDRIAPIPSLVNSNYYIAYHGLKHVLETGVGGDLTFCEWGSGLGVVTCIASQLGFNATGIEIEHSLCEFAMSLAKEIGVKAEFIQGSYRNLPRAGCETRSSLPIPLGDLRCAVIYAYPWPAEEPFIESLFGRVASESSLLISYHGGTSLRVRRRAT